MFSASDVRDTLLLLAPGFLALKIFAWRGFQIRRTDLEWTMWSLLVAGVVNGVLTLVGLSGPAVVIASFITAVVIGFVGGWLWTWWASKHEHALAPVAMRAWDVVLLNRTRWVQVKLKDGSRVFGRTRTVAESAATDDLDLYLTECSWVKKDGSRVPMADVEGVLIPRTDITRLQVLKGKAKPVSPNQAT